LDLGIAGKKALVCGASKGMGRAIAEGLAREGVRVFMTARSEESLKREAETISKHAKNGVDYAVCDLANESLREKLIEAVKSKFGNIDILVHNTGGPSPSSTEETQPQAWQAGFDALFQSVIQLNQAFVPAMKAQKWGRIINVTSLSVMEPIANLAISNAIRTAATAMFKTLSDELAPYEITVNSVAPGSIATGRIEELVKSRAQKANITEDEYRKEYINVIPMQRMGTPEEFAAVVCFLSSSQASYVTGSTICVDGGKRRSIY
jgi:3-oxoacyl-[acyl-carrier protein] reductase